MWHINWSKCHNLAFGARPLLVWNTESNVSPLWYHVNNKYIVITLNYMEKNIHSDIQFSHYSTLKWDDIFRTLKYCERRMSGSRHCSNQNYNSNSVTWFETKLDQNKVCEIVCDSRNLQNITSFVIHLTMASTDWWYNACRQSDDRRQGICIHAYLCNQDRLQQCIVPSA